MSIEQVEGTIELKHELLNSEESQFLDYKETGIAPSKLQRHFVAFANTDGGELLVGISDRDGQKRKISGFQSQKMPTTSFKFCLVKQIQSLKEQTLKLLTLAVMAGSSISLFLKVPKSITLLTVVATSGAMRALAESKVRGLHAYRTPKALIVMSVCL